MLVLAVLVTRLFATRLLATRLTVSVGVGLGLDLGVGAERGSRVRTVVDARLWRLRARRVEIDDVALRRDIAQRDHAHTPTVGTNRLELEGARRVASQEGGGRARVAAVWHEDVALHTNSRQDQRPVHPGDRRVLLGVEVIEWGSPQRRREGHFDDIAVSPRAAQSQMAAGDREPPAATPLTLTEPVVTSHEGTRIASANVAAAAADEAALLTCTVSVAVRFASAGKCAN